MSDKRRANLRSDLTAAIDASGLHPILKTGALALDAEWKALLDPIPDRRIKNDFPGSPAGAASTGSRLAPWTRPLSAGLLMISLPEP